MKMMGFNLNDIFALQNSAPNSNVAATNTSSGVPTLPPLAQGGSLAQNMAAGGSMSGTNGLAQFLQTLQGLQSNQTNNATQAPQQQHALLPQNLQQALPYLVQSLGSLSDATSRLAARALEPAQQMKEELKHKMDLQAIQQAITGIGETLHDIQEKIAKISNNVLILGDSMSSLKKEVRERKETTNDKPEL